MSWLGSIRTRIPAPYPWVAAVLLVALLLRAAIPAGWMPAPQAGFGAPFVICTAHGDLVLGQRPGETPHKPAAGHEVCAFAGVHAAPAPEADLAMSSAVFEPIVAPLAPTRQRPERAPRHRDQAQRAPPLAA
jgi:hypothetical protein